MERIKIENGGVWPDPSGEDFKGLIWSDDAQIESWDGSRMHHDLKNPRTEIIVRLMD